ncbi:Anti-sigma regulatory factor (Ser/Thr protein kinase) [Gloeomargarita lithophora Alchichica-D10]|uniref:Anti-sigma regulatory factor (Ser/Thr protein kinase) n=1 Tax=Gloeomargarita lithophora Alchichica-D10 TaxID=1188229 RepID=A0A1J0ACT1_9CYAN|nr:ATP-binding protein [Gloeomargarita lithophora]APB33741.1 Anti-sigma regulatory factor (Ser/Thr protein kinase) [Gloeomargarita lithophora Alchichica-D10]
MNFALRASRIVVNSNLAALTQVLDWFAQFNEPPLTYELWWFCQLVLDEGFTNAVRHAHRDLPPTTPITVEVQVFAESIEMRIWDHGPGFDLNRKLSELTQAPQDPEPEGGMGLVFLQKFADVVDYQRQQEQNCLFLCKYLTAVATA